MDSFSLLKHLGAEDGIGAAQCSAMGLGAMATAGAPSKGNDDLEFFTYHYKVDPCPLRVPHDWAQCSFAHKQGGERSVRRDLRRFPYLSIPCEFAKQKQPCPKGDNCPHAHSLFEYYLHPDRFRTEVCQYGLACKRPVCFFAHTPEQLRPIDPSLPPAELCWQTGASLRFGRNKNRSGSGADGGSSGGGGHRGGASKSGSHYPADHMGGPAAAAPRSKRSSNVSGGGGGHGSSSNGNGLGPAASRGGAVLPAAVAAAAAVSAALLQAPLPAVSGGFGMGVSSPLTISGCHLGSQYGGTSLDQSLTGQLCGQLGRLRSQLLGSAMHGEVGGQTAGQLRSQLLDGAMHGQLGGQTGSQLGQLCGQMPDQLGGFFDMAALSTALPCNPGLTGREARGAAGVILPPVSLPSVMTHTPVTLPPVTPPSMTTACASSAPMLNWQGLGSASSMADACTSGDNLQSWLMRAGSGGPLMTNIGSFPLSLPSPGDMAAPAASAGPQVVFVLVPSSALQQGGGITTSSIEQAQGTGSPVTHQSVSPLSGDGHCSSSSICSSTAYSMACQYAAADCGGSKRSTSTNGTP